MPVTPPDITPQDAELTSPGPEPTPSAPADTLEAAQAAGGRTRTRDPRYDVFERVEMCIVAVDEETGEESIGERVAGFVPVDQDVAAANRREAIKCAVSERPEAQRYGDFATVKTGELQEQSRKKKVVEDDDWS